MSNCSDTALEATLRDGNFFVFPNCTCSLKVLGKSNAPFLRYCILKKTLSCCMHTKSTEFS